MFVWVSARAVSWIKNVTGASDRDTKYCVLKETERRDIPSLPTSISPTLDQKGTFCLLLKKTFLTVPCIVLNIMHYDTTTILNLDIANMISLSSPCPSSAMKKSSSNAVDVHSPPMWASALDSGDWWKSTPTSLWCPNINFLRVGSSFLCFVPLLWQDRIKYIDCESEMEQTSLTAHSRMRI